ncbi:MAG: hypothetical protein LBJ78_00075 [Puniceicoccales bacterium]|jgi:hypothetical protein|nr:hypothetical protein [Puniceicoccales bacterium]
MAAKPPGAAETTANAYKFAAQTDLWNHDNVTTIDRAASTIVGLVAKGETQMNALLTELSSVDPGQLDQSRLMAAQMTMTRWQLASQLLTNFQSGVATGLKNVIQNIR